MQIARSHVLVCGGTGCLSSHSDKLRERLAEKLKELGIADEIQIIETGCFGLCAEGPYRRRLSGGRDVFQSDTEGYRSDRRRASAQGKNRGEAADRKQY